MTIKNDNLFDANNAPLLSRIMREFGLSLHETTHLVQTAPRRYKEYDIPKKYRDGVRHIAHPAAELKILQRWLVANYLENLPVHPAAMAYEINTSIKMNAEAHEKNKYLMKLDFKNFFPSIKPRDLIILFDNNCINMKKNDQIALTQLLFWKPKKTDKLQLSIGAPSSPKISNLVMYKFDETVTDYCKKNKIIYTRFADDLTFSTNTPNILLKCLEFIKQLLEDLPSPRLKLNQEKVVFSSMKFNRRVTGLVLSNDGTVSLGHDKKRIIRASIHHFTQGRLNPKEIESLRGMLAYASSVEADFITRMGIKYGSAVIKSIKSYKFSSAE